MENYNEWTSCEMYGHLYVDSEVTEGLRICTDCGDTYMDD